MQSAASGTITYKRLWDLDTFLKQHVPSELTSPEIFWIRIPGPGHKNVSTPLGVEYVQSLFHKLTASETDITADDIKAIAEATRNTRGHWIIYRKAKSVDEVWEKIARTVASGTMAIEAKVSSRNGAQTCRNNEHSIFVYTSDYTDTDDVMRVEQQIRSMGITGTLYYKPDIYAVLGIYFRNPWNISPYVHVTKS